MKKWGIAAALLLILNLIVPVSATESASIVSRTVEAVLHQDKTITVSEKLLIDGTGGKETSIYLSSAMNDSVHTIENLEIESDQALVFSEGEMVRISPDTLTEMTLNYTIRYFADDDPELETVQYNLAENPLRLDVQKLNVTLTVDPSLKIQNQLLDCDQKDSGACFYGEGIWEDQVYTYEATEVLRYSEIEMILNFDQNDFSEVQQYQWPLHFGYRYLDIDMDKDRHMHITQQFRLERNEKQRLEMTLYPGWPNYPEAGLENIQLSDPLLEVSKMGYLELPSKTPLELSLEYDVVSKKQSPRMHLDLDQFFNEASCDDLRVTIHFEEPYEYRLNCFETINYEDAEEIKIEVNEEGTEFVITNTAPVRGNIRMTMDLDVPINRNLFSFSGMTLFLQLMCVGIAFSALLFRAVSAVRIRRYRGDIPQVDPMSAALLQGNKVSTEQVAAVIMNWVAMGNVRVIHKNSQVLLEYVRLPYGPQWESELYRDLFSLGDGMSVGLNQISSRGNRAISKAMDSAVKEIQSLHNRALQLLVHLFLILSTVAALACGLMISTVTFDPSLSRKLIIMLTVWTVVTGFLARSTKFRYKVPVMIGAGFVWFILFTLMMGEFYNFEGGMAMVSLSMLIVHCVSSRQLGLCREGQRMKQSVVLWLKDFRRMRNMGIELCLEQNQDYGLQTYSYAWILRCTQRWKRYFMQRMLPKVDTVLDEEGRRCEIWCLDELREQLILCCSAR